MHHPSVIPVGALDTLAAVAKDAVVCSLLPEGTLQALLPLLSVLRPDVAQVLAAAAEAETAHQRSLQLVDQV
jgi:hypothetical protein